MAKLFLRLFSVVLILSNASCSVNKRKDNRSESKEVSTDQAGNNLNEPQLETRDPVNTNLYQLGDTWDRDYTQVSHPYHNTVFKTDIGSPDGKRASNFILAEKINEQEAYFFGTVHSLPSPCITEGVSLHSKDRTFLAECTEVYSIVPETDIVIFSVKFYESEDLEELLPVKISNERPAFGDKVRFFGIGSALIPGYFPLMTDSEDDCRVISRFEKRIIDPDEKSTIRDEAFWSHAVTCDVEHGDSGGMVVNREGELVGILWTGAYPKNKVYSSQMLQDYLNGEDNSLNDFIWTDFNYITPAYRIRDHLEVIKLERAESGEE